MHRMHGGADMQSRQDSHRAPPRPLSLKITPQIKSNPRPPGIPPLPHNPPASLLGTLPFSVRKGQGHSQRVPPHARSLRGHCGTVYQEQRWRDELTGVGGQLSALQEELEALRAESSQLRSERDQLELEHQRAADARERHDSEVCPPPPPPPILVRCSQVRCGAAGHVARSMGVTPLFPTSNRVGYTRHR